MKRPEIKLKVTHTLEVPRVPNYIIYASDPSERSVCIADLDEEQLNYIAKEWRLALHARAKQIREQRIIK